MDLEHYNTFDQKLIQFLNFSNLDSMGNSILHIAVIYNKIDLVKNIIEYLKINPKAGLIDHAGKIINNLLNSNDIVSGFLSSLAMINSLNRVNIIYLPNLSNKTPIDIAFDMNYNQIYLMLKEYKEYIDYNGIIVEDVNEKELMD
jgi:ankyrin repeat protein